MKKQFLTLLITILSLMPHLLLAQTWVVTTIAGWEEDGKNMDGLGQKAHRLSLFASDLLLDGSGLTRAVGSRLAPGSPFLFCGPLDTGSSSRNTWFSNPLQGYVKNCCR